MSQHPQHSQQPPYYSPSPDEQGQGVSGSGKGSRVPPIRVTNPSSDGHGDAGFQQQISYNPSHPLHFRGPDVGELTNTYSVESGSDLPNYEPGDTLSQQEIELLDALSSRDILQLYANAIAQYGASSRKALLARSLEEEQLRNQSASQAGGDKHLGVKPTTEARGRSVARRASEGLSSLKQIVKRSKSRSPQEVESQRPWEPTGSRSHYTPDSSADRIISGSPARSSFNILGPSFPSGWAFPPVWEPATSGLTFLYDPGNDSFSRISLSPHGTRIVSSRDGFTAVPEGRVWGTSPTIEFLVLPGSPGLPPIVFDCRNNRPVSKGLAKQLKGLRDLADQEAERVKAEENPTRFCNPCLGPNQLRHLRT